MKTRAYGVEAQLPPVLRYDPDKDVRDVLGVSPPCLYAKMVVHLERLQNIFFVLRLLVQRGHADSHADLLGISFEMVSTALVFWTHMDRLAGLHDDYEWLVRQVWV